MSEQVRQRLANDTNDDRPPYMASTCSGTSRHNLNTRHNYQMRRQNLGSRLKAGMNMQVDNCLITHYMHLGVLRERIKCHR